MKAASLAGPLGICVVLFGLGQVCAQPTAPQIVGFRRVGTSWQVSFSTQVNFVYALQRTSTLTPGDWLTVADNVPGTGQTVTLTDAPTNSPTFYRVFCYATRGQVVLNEVMTGSPGSAGDEFVELYNASPFAVYLAGWKLRYQSGTSTAVSTSFAFSNQWIGAHGFMLLAGAAYSGAAPADGHLAVGLSGTAGGLGLEDASGTRSDSMSWGTFFVSNLFVEGTTATAPPAGQSLGRLPDGFDTGNNAVDFRVMSTPTPRGPNVP